MSYYGANHYGTNHYGTNYYGPKGAVVVPDTSEIRGGGGVANARRKQIAEDDLIMNMVMDKFLEIMNAKRL